MKIGKKLMNMGKRFILSEEIDLPKTEVKETEVKETEPEKIELIFSQLMQNIDNYNGYNSSGQIDIDTSVLGEYLNGKR